MKDFLLYTLSMLVLLTGYSFSEAPASLDNDVAFFEGESYNYVIYPPDNFRMVIDTAATDGYSFAFIPDNKKYDSSEMIIGVNYYKIKGLKFEKVIRDDTTNIRKHYGTSVTIYPVDSTFNSVREIVPTFFINDRERFIPNVMISYYNGGSEIVIFELVITDRIPRFKAEDIYLQCIRRFKPMLIGELGYE